jgi:hypothetical protein
MVASPTRTMACTPRTSVDLRPIRRPSNRLSNCGKWSFPHAATGQSRGPAFSASGRRPAGWVSDQMITRSGAPNRGAASDLVVGRTSRKFPELPKYFPGHRHDSWRIRTTKSRFVTSRTLNTMARAATITLSFTAMHTGDARYQLQSPPLRSYRLRRSGVLVADARGNEFSWVPQHRDGCDGGR